MQRSGSFGVSGSPVSIQADGSTKGGVKHPTYNEAIQQEYELELRDLEAPAGPPPPAAAEPTELDKAGATVVIEEPPEGFRWDQLCTNPRLLPGKLRGGLDTRLPIPPLIQLAWAWAGAFLGILSVAALNQWVSPEIGLPLIVGSFGASAVLVFAIPDSKLSQPRNFVGGQVLSALIGVVCRLVLDVIWICQPLAMSLSLLGMQLTSTTHPPGGATALIIASTIEMPKWHGFSYVVAVAWGSAVMLLVALLVNNLNPRRGGYPTYWW